MYEVHFFTLPYYFGYSLRYFSSPKCDYYSMMHFSNLLNLFTASSNQTPNQLIPDYAKEQFIQSYTILSIWSILSSSIIDVYLQLDLFFVFFLSTYLLHLAISCPHFFRVHTIPPYCIINLNGAFSSHYMTWKKNYSITIELFRFVILQINFYKASKNWLPNRRKKYYIRVQVFPIIWFFISQKNKVNFV